MAKKHLIMLLAVIGLGLAGCKPTEKSTADDSEGTGGKGATSVGTYDSRLIALAYWSQKVDGKERLNHPDYNSVNVALAYWSQDVGGKPRYEPPVDERLKGKEFGYMLHQLVFSHHEPVQALEYIGDKLPEVMKQAGVDVIVSKWDKEKLAGYDSAKLVDVTDSLVELYDPTEEFLKGAAGFDNSTPEPLDTNWLEAEE